MKQSVIRSFRSLRGEKILEQIAYTETLDSAVESEATAVAHLRMRAIGQQVRDQWSADPAEEVAFSVPKTP